jgi:hypothetical protein
MARFLVAIVLLGLILAACTSPVAPTQSAPSSRPSIPIGTPPSSQPPIAEPSAPSTSAPSEPPADSVPIPANTYARVVTDDLRVRSKPGVSDDSKKLEPLLVRGGLVVVLDGPVRASGYDWYQVQPTYSFEQETAYPFGWVAAADKNGDPWIQPETVECPAPPTTLDEFEHVFENDQAYYEITCFSGMELSLAGWLTTPSEWCGLGAETVVEPLWLDECGTAPNYVVDVAGEEWDKSLHPAWSPDVDLTIAPPAESPPDSWPHVEVTGQFDHPSARTCRALDDDPDRWAFEPAEVTCRRRFVVTSMHLIED